MRTEFDKELNWINNIGIRTFVASALELLPDYFFDVAASSSGKFHPEYALGPGGLVRHTRAAVVLAKDMLGLEMYSKFTPDERDIIIGALILHDGWKQGLGSTGCTVFEHPKICADWLAALNHSSLMSDEQFRKLYGCIASHMGQWNTNRYSDVVLPKPKTAMEKFVHMCDYLASRRYLEVGFNKINFDGERL